MATLLDKLEKRFGRWAIPDLTFWVMVTQIAIFAFDAFTRFDVTLLMLQPSEVLQGQVWRLATFIVVPTSLPPITTGMMIFLAFEWYLFWLMGSTLEKEWGEFRYNMFFLCGAAATAAFSFLAPDGVGTNGFLMGSVFLAFARLYPNFELLLFFILPVKIKWLALITWIFYGIIFIAGGWMGKLMVLAATLNYWMFFGREIFVQAKAGKRRMEYKAQRAVEEKEPFHKCVICGKTDQSHPDMEFAYLDGEGYCEEHWPEMDKRQAAKT
ncbi:rhomboid family intramembrane serine protease [Cerasicoccus frondis]|uniref:rhomboid family intramembrane serine protease n=1 Tax=Cerasicoccus frondis TaxID=490090 RepID=UPI0028524B27|nr:rhomboid family intramembrane serine protease [Cerasicoccus frondis]